MKALKKICITAFLALTFVLPAVSFGVETKEASAAGTGYTKASDVDYIKSGKYVANWGARDEDCVFLSMYAKNFYTGSYKYEVLSQEKGGTTQSNAHNSELYSSLHTLMSSKQTYQTTYNATRDLFCYTDCLQSNYSKISSFYSAKMISGTWDGGKTWNREHTWPNSKGDLSGNGENDIMMLRPASVSENSSRGNKAYGKSSGYYDPNEEGQSLRGDCARIVLYQYVRWKCINTGSGYNPNNIFGTKGVIESLSVLLDWIEEDPVDTWEMGRNDAVQSITGTRNVFVDYPEYAFLLFGEEVPDMVTPSGMAGEGMTTPPASSEDKENSSVENEKPDSSVDSGKPDGSEEDESGSNSSMGGSNVDSDEEVCEHEFSKWIVTKEPTETEEGERRRVCTLCNQPEKESIPALGEACAHEFSKWIVTKEPTETEEGERRRVCTLCNQPEKETLPKVGANSAPAGENVSLGCAASVGTSIGGVLLTLAACVVLEKKRKR